MPQDQATHSIVAATSGAARQKNRRPGVRAAIVRSLRAGPGSSPKLFQGDETKKAIGRDKNKQFGAMWCNSMPVAPMNCGKAKTLKHIGLDRTHVNNRVREWARKFRFAQLRGNEIDVTG